MVGAYLEGVALLHDDLGGVPALLDGPVRMLVVVGEDAPRGALAERLQALIAPEEMKRG